MVPQAETVAGNFWAKGDGDADWVVLSESVANPAAGCEVTCDVNRTNCQLKVY